MRVQYLIFCLALIVVACGSASQPETLDDVAGEVEGEAGLSAGSDVSEDAMAVLMIDDETFVFEANEFSRCIPGTDDQDPEAYFGDGEEIAYGSEDFDFVSFVISSSAD